MVRLILAVVAMMLASPAPAQTIVLDDTFGGATLTPGRYKTDAWRFSGYPQEETLPGNGEFQRYATGQAKVSASILQLTARPMTGIERVAWVGRVLDPAMKVPPAFARNLLSVSHVSGLVTTYPNMPFAPGRKLSARFRIPVGPALWPAIWAFDYVNQTEVDLFEGSGRPASDPQGNFSQGRHDFKANIHGGCPKRALAAGWHVAEADWSDPAEIVLSYDGIANCTVPAGPNMTQPMAVNMNLAIGSQTWGWIGTPVGNTPNDASFWIDWWKVTR